MRRVLSRKGKWVVSQFEAGFTLDIDKIPDPKGDRVKITMNGQVPREEDIRVGPADLNVVYKDRHGCQPIDLQN